MERLNLNRVLQKLLGLVFCAQATLLVAPAIAHATGAYRSPCEQQDANMQDALNKLKSCLDRAAFLMKKPSPPEVSTICLKEDNTFKEATRSFRECRIKAASPTPSIMNVRP